MQFNRYLVGKKMHLDQRLLIPACHLYYSIQYNTFQLPFAPLQSIECQPCNAFDHETEDKVLQAMSKEGFSLIGSSKQLSNRQNLLEPNADQEKNDHIEKGLTLRN